MMTRSRIARGSLTVVAVGLAIGFAWLGLSGERSGDSEDLRRGLREPSAVAALDGARIAVADSAAGSVSLFGPDGGRLWVRDRGFDRPSGIGADPQGVWVADTGNRRVVLLGARDGSPLQSLPLESRPTDVARTYDGSLWISAAPDNLLLRLDPDGTVELALTEVDDQPLRAPRGVAADGEGGVFVCEALGGQVLHLDASGSLLSRLGRIGVGAGRFAKPKDVTPLGERELAVLDNELGLVQILDRKGAFLRLLGRGGEPLRFRHPLGIAAVGDELAVADAGSAAVHLIALDPAGDVSWEDFPHALTLLHNPLPGTGDRSAKCRQCHDGTAQLGIGNWDPGASQHPLAFDGGFRPPEEIALTEGGGLDCGSCHQIHDVEDDDGGEATTDHCETCHGDRVAAAVGPQPTGHVLRRALPSSANRAVLQGRRNDLDEVIGCRTCHTPHGARYPHLLTASGDNGDLCRACHLMPGAVEGAHPLSASRHASSIDAVLSSNGVMGPDGEMTCLSCHANHDARSGPLLRFEGGAEGACRACHTDLESVHDAQWHPDNSCVECHSLHGKIRPDSEDCAECHEEQQVLADAGGHGSATCLDCHPADGEDPFAEWLPDQVNPINRRCLGCHDPNAQESDAPLISEFEHPLRNVIPADDTWAVQGRLPLYDEAGQQVPDSAAGEFACTTCHVFHGPEPGAMSPSLRREAWRATCWTCHGQDALMRYQYFHEPHRGEL